uniref:Uncharacterized protein n=1 Tax=Glossina brevipalpis TaxID=37001 RepID=A0A1A9WIE3_9MUSC
MENMFQCKKKQKFRSDRGDALMFDNSRIPAPKRDRPQYLYVDPNFLCQVTRPRAGGQTDDYYYDCTTSGECESQVSTVGAGVVEDVSETDPKNFKCLLKEVAFTTHVLYKAFSKAYNKSVKAVKRQGSYCTCSMPAVREVVGDSQHGALPDSAKTPSTGNDAMESQHIPYKSSKTMSLKRQKCIRMEPIAFSVPLKLLVESPTCCETVTAEILMEAFGEPLCICGKSKRRKNEEEPIRTATIAAGYSTGGAVGTSGIDQYQAFLENLRSHDLQNVPSQNIPEAHNKSEKYLAACSCHASKIQRAIESGAAQEGCQAVFEFVKPEHIKNLQKPISATVFKVGSDVYFSCASSEHKLQTEPSIKSINGNVYDLLKRYHSSQTSIPPPHMLRSIASYDYDDYVVAPRSKRPYKPDAIKSPKSFEYPSKVKRLSADLLADHSQAEFESVRPATELLQADKNKVSQDTQTYPLLATKEQESQYAKDQVIISSYKISQDTQTDAVYMKSPEEKESKGPSLTSLKVSKNTQTDPIKILDEKPLDELLPKATVNTQTETEELRKGVVEPTTLMKSAADVISDKSTLQDEIKESPEKQLSEIQSDATETTKLGELQTFSDKILTERISSMAWFKSREKELRGDLKSIQTQTESLIILDDFKDIGDQPRADDIIPSKLKEYVEDLKVPVERFESVSSEILKKRNKMDGGTQTEAVLFQGGHNKRKVLRAEILENLRCFLDPIENNYKCTYTAEDREQIGKDLHKILAPGKTSRKTQQEICNTIVEDLRYLFTPLPEAQRKGIPQISTLTPERSNEIRVLDDIRHVLDPRNGVKPEHYFTKTEQEKLLDLLNSVLKPRNTPENQLDFEARQSLIKDIRKILESRSDRSVRLVDSSDSEKASDKNPDSSKRPAEDTKPIGEAEVPIESTQEITNIQPKNLLEGGREALITTESVNIYEFSFGSSSTISFSDAEFFETQTPPRKIRINEEIQTEPLNESFSKIFTELSIESLSKLTTEQSTPKQNSQSYIIENEIEYEPSAKRRRSEPPIPPPKPKKARKRSFPTNPDDSNILPPPNTSIAERTKKIDVAILTATATQTELFSFTEQKSIDIKTKKHNISTFIQSEETWIESNKNDKTEYEDMESEANKENDDKISRQRTSRTLSSRQTLEEKLRKFSLDENRHRPSIYEPPEMFKNKRERWKPQEDFRPFNKSYDRTSVPKIAVGKSTERRNTLTEQIPQFLGATQTTQASSIHNETIDNVDLNFKISGNKKSSKEPSISRLSLSNESTINQIYTSREPSRIDVVILKSLLDLSKQGREVNKNQKSVDQIKTNSSSKLSVSPIRIESFEPKRAIADVSTNTVRGSDNASKTLEMTSSLSKSKLKQRDKQNSPQPRDYESSSLSIQRQGQIHLPDRLSALRDYLSEKFENIDDLNRSSQIYHNLQQESNFYIQNDLNKNKIEKEHKERKRISPTAREIPSQKEQLKEFPKYKEYSTLSPQFSRKRSNNSTDHEHVRDDTPLIDRQVNESYVARMASEIMKATSFARLETTSTKQERQNFAKSKDSQIFPNQLIPSRMYKDESILQRPKVERYIKPRPSEFSFSQGIQQRMRKQEEDDRFTSDSQTTSSRSQRPFPPPLVYRTQSQKHKQELFLKLRESELQKQTTRSTISSDSDFSPISQHSLSRMRTTSQKIAESGASLENDIATTHNTFDSDKISERDLGSSQNSITKVRSTLPKIHEVNNDAENEKSTQNTYIPTKTNPNIKPDDPNDDAKKT